MREPRTLYVPLKCGDAAIPAPERLRACAAAVADRTWLHVDPWEALHRRVAVNYTDVAARLRAYLRAHVDPRVDVLYVCGGDNARFAQAFVSDGGCVVVARPSAEGEFARWRSQLAGNPRILWTDGDHPGTSRTIRADAWHDVGARRIVMRVEDARTVRTLNRRTRVASRDPRDGGAVIEPVALPFDAFQRELAALLAAHASVRSMFAATDHHVRDLPTPTRATFAHLGAERSLTDVCRWHIDRLQDDA
ncbi:MAG TPA: hypothetical protein VHN14_14670 [Kofleriaceae bacterium]|jgi:hypothetical protein|nr:hypothetical protein [Kofleriaceae bacterium]